MVREFKLPDVGEGVAEGEIVQWLVSEGDEVSEDQPVAEVETDKAVVEVPSPVNGSVKGILAEEGEVVPVGNVIITFNVEGEEDEEATESADEEEPTESQEQVSEEPADIGGEPAVTDADADGTGSEAETASGRVFAPPNVRRLARELGVSIGSIDGSGPSGRVTEGDVQAAAEGGGGDGKGAEEETGGPKQLDEDLESATSQADESGGDGEPTAQPEAASRDRTLAAPATRKLAEEEGIDILSPPRRSATARRSSPPKRFGSTRRLNRKHRPRTPRLSRRPKRRASEPVERSEKPANPTEGFAGRSVSRWRTRSSPLRTSPTTTPPK